MCGIMAYIGKKQAYPILIDGLKKLEYRGYDSSGVAVMNGSLSVLKKEGKVNALENFAIGKKTDGNIGLGHTRWATHGKPSDVNAHPHQSTSGRFTIVHNGIIENHSELKKMLLDKGFKFQSQTDSEVLVNLIEWQQKEYHLSMRESLSRSLEIVEGSFAIVLFDLINPSKLWAARRKSPLVVGVGKEDIYLSSDIIPIAQYVDQAIYVEDDIIVELEDNGDYSFFNLNGFQVCQMATEVQQDSYEADKGEFDSYMLKEIHDQPSVAHRFLQSKKDTELFESIDRIVIVACGSSYHSGLYAEYIIEKYARINVEVEYASEFRYKNPVFKNNDLVIGISQSGETADTMAALELAKENQCTTMAWVNVPNSSIARLVDHVVLINAGPEIGVASTKAFTNQLLAGVHTTMSFLKKSNVECLQSIEDALKMIPFLMGEILYNSELDSISKVLADHQHAIYLGRGNLFPIALEGALKLKEISYIHAEGYAAGEMKHGPIALIDEKMPLVALCANDEHLPKILSNIEEVKARGGIIIIVKTDSVTIPHNLADHIISIPDTIEMLYPILMNIPLQIMAYQAAKMLGKDVDKPRNLAKSVTVE